MAKIFCITLEPIDTKMAGPAIRCINLAIALSLAQHDVCVYTPYPTNYDIENRVKLLSNLANNDKFYEEVRKYDILFIQANVLKVYQDLTKLNKFLVVDLYDPYLFSVLSQYQNDEFLMDTSYRLMHSVLDKHMLSLDFAICASERQRDYYLGRFCTLGRLQSAIYNQDPTLRKLIEVVPFGLLADKPQHNQKVLRGVYPNINADDIIMIWGGGIWDWFDPLTIIEAVSRLIPKYPKLKLFFMGRNSPNPQVEIMSMAEKAINLSIKLGLNDKHIFFSQNWIPYAERGNYLLESDIAVSAHFDLIETRFSFRTRILDYFWAGLPILTTCGDDFSQIISANRAGISLNFKDVDAWCIAIESLINNTTLRAELAANSAALRENFYWFNVAKPLIKYCQNPYKMPKLTKLQTPSLLERIFSVYRRGGAEAIIRKTKEFIKQNTPV